MSEEIANLLELVTAGEWGNNQGTPGGVDTGVIRSANFTKDHQFNAKEIVVRSIEERKRQKKMLKHGDILIEKSGGSPDQPVGRVLFYDLKGEHTCSNFISILRPSQQVDPKFLYYSLCNLYGRGVVKNYQQQTTGIINLQLGEYLRETIYHPPLPEQKKIAEILSGIDTEIESLSKAIDLHRKTRNALIESIFEDGHKKAENGSNEWKVWSIEDLLASTATPMRSGPFGSALLKEELAKEGIPFLGIDNVRTEEFVLNFKRFLTDEKFKELRRYEVFPQDVMITIMGTVGRSCVVPEGIGPCVSSKHTWTMTFDHSKVAPEIVCWHLNHYGRTRTKFLESSQGGVMDAISSLTLRETKIPIPTSRVFAEQIVGHYKSSHNHEQALNDKFRKIKLLKNAVSSDLLSGRKRVTI